jgi:hypothetical protein
MLSGRPTAPASLDGHRRESGLAIASGGNDEAADDCAEDDGAPSATDTMVARTLRA